MAKEISSLHRLRCGWRLMRGEGPNDGRTTYKRHHCSDQVHDGGNHIIPEDFCLTQSTAKSEVAQPKQFDVGMVDFVALVKVTDQFSDVQIDSCSTVQNLQEMWLRGTGRSHEAAW